MGEGREGGGRVGPDRFKSLAHRGSRGSFPKRGKTVGEGREEGGVQTEERGGQTTKNRFFPKGGKKGREEGEEIFCAKCIQRASMASLLPGDRERREGRDKGRKNNREQQIPFPLVQSKSIDMSKLGFLPIRWKVWLYVAQYRKNC